MEEHKPNLVKDEFASSMYINIDEYLRLRNAANKAKQNLDIILDRLSHVSESKACTEMGKLFADGFIDGIKNTKLTDLYNTEYDNTIPKGNLVFKDKKDDTIGEIVNIRSE